ncbi:hypothetical protein IWQ61_009859, partial [Dispira simplex]
MKISVLAFAPLGLVALLATVSAGPTDPTMDTGAIDKDIRTQMTLGQVYWMIEDTVDEVRSIFADTTTKEFTVTRVDEMFELARTKFIFWEKNRVEKLDETNPAENGISFSELLKHCKSVSDVIATKIRDNLVNSFSNKPIPRNLFEDALSLEHLKSKYKILIDDYTTIKDYLEGKYGEQVVINREVFMKEFNKGI